MSRIEWTNETWNPLRGCSRVSTGCGGSNGGGCYAERMAHRFSGPGQPYEGLTRMTKHGPRWTGEVRFVSEQLDAPLRWRKPRMVFVNSMSDLFHDKVSDEQIASVFGVVAVASGKFHGPSDGAEKIGETYRMPNMSRGPHIFQVLTKRPKRAKRLLVDRSFRVAVGRAAYRLAMDRRDAGWLYQCVTGDREWGNHCTLDKLWPLPNLWLGVSCENQAAADERIPLLLQTPAAIRWVSAEPLLGPIDFRSVPYGNPEHNGEFADLDWVVVGSESGPGARPMDEDWVRSIRNQCFAAEVPLFYKQRLDGGRKVSLPLLDGVRWDRFPDP